MKILLLFLAFFCQLQAFDSPTVFSPGYIKEQMVKYKFIKATPDAQKKEAPYDGDNHKYHLYIYGKAETYENIELLKELEPDTPVLRNLSAETDEMFSPTPSQKQTEEEANIQEIPSFFVNPHPSILLQNHILRAIQPTQITAPIKLIRFLTRSSFF